MQTFKDALQVQKSTADRATIARALHAAAQRRDAESATTLEKTTSPSFVVLSSGQDAQAAYQLLSEQRTSKAFLLLEAEDALLTLPLVRSVLVYNYGIAHRCCSAATTSSEQPNTPQQLGSFCLQIFQYAESLLPAASNNDNSNNNDLLLFRLLLTRNLMMLSCRLGLSLCEHYKETLDPIVAEILESSPAASMMLPQDDDKAPAA